MTFSEAEIYSSHTFLLLMPSIVYTNTYDYNQIEGWIDEMIQKGRHKTVFKTYKSAKFSLKKRIQQLKSELDYSLTSRENFRADHDYFEKKQELEEMNSAKMMQVEWKKIYIIHS